MDNAPDEWVVLRMNRVACCCCSSQVVKIQAGLLLSLEVAVAGLADDQERGPVICLRGEFFRNLALAENWKCCGLTPSASWLLCSSYSFSTPELSLRPASWMMAARSRSRRLPATQSYRATKLWTSKVCPWDDDACIHCPPAKKPSRHGAKKGGSLRSAAGLQNGLIHKTRRREIYWGAIRTLFRALKSSRSKTF